MRIKCEKRKQQLYKKKRLNTHTKTQLSQIQGKFIHSNKNRKKNPGKVQKSQ